MNQTKKRTTTRNPEQTKKRILEAAIQEFSERGFARARMDKVAEISMSNKRMIYYYYGDKDGLFTAIVEHEYLRFRKAEEEVCSPNLPPVMALQRLVEFTWNYYLENPNYLILVNSQNLFKAEHLKRSKTVLEAHKKAVHILQNILDLGVKQGVFRTGIDTHQLQLTIASVCYYYFSNRYTQSYLLDDDLMNKENLQKRLHFNIDSIMRIVCK